MNVTRLVKTNFETDVRFAGITLLSVEEYEECKKNIPLLKHWWWLRSPGIYDNCAAIVDSDGDAFKSGYYTNDENGAVRPALRIANPETANLQIGDRFITECMGDENEWIVISDDLALSVEAIEVGHFRGGREAKDAIYEVSAVKEFIEDWAAENDIKFEKKGE